MNRNFTPHVVVLAIFCTLRPAMAQQRVPLTTEERQKVSSLVESADAFKSVPTTRRVLCELTAVRHKTADGRESKVVTAYHFEYKDGSALRSTVVLPAGTVEVVRLEAYSPPLAPEERTKAIELAIAKVPAIRAVFEEGHEVRTELMPSVVADKKSERFGHRLVRVNVLPDQSGSAQTLSVDLDLTSQSVVGPPPASRPPSDEPTATIEQAFPIGAAPAQQETAWRIKFGVTTHVAGEILHIQEAHFRRGRTEPWLQILGDCRLAEMFVPYNNGTTRYYDITSVGGTLARLTAQDFGPACLGSGQLLLNDKVARELHDGQNLWFDHRLSPGQRSRRVEEIHLWAVMPAGNYAYPMLFVFRSDGSAGFYAAATAHNLTGGTDDNSTHLHMGCWRLNVVLGDQARNRIEVVRFESSSASGAVAKTVVEPFHGGMEGGIEWKAEEFLRLRVTSEVALNDHQPPNRIGYELVPVRQGNGRTYGAGEEWTHKDLWVTLPTSPGGAVQDRYRELPTYVARPRSIDSRAAVIWCQSALIHRPRDEDFGQAGYHPGKGLALTAWTGFELKPRNLFAKTPLYP
jgi:hypothetical protein